MNYFERINTAKGITTPAPPDDDDEEDAWLALFDQPAKARGTDPETSHRAKQFSLNADRVAVLLMHVKHPAGMTDYDLAFALGRQQTSVGVRRGELRDHGFIEETDMKRPAPSGSSCLVWRVTPLGVRLAQFLLRRPHLWSENI